MKSLKDHAFNLGTSKVKLINSKIAKQVKLLTEIQIKNYCS